jgi:SAM-dependent methyltransferase
MSAPAPDFAGIKQRQRQTWASGNFAEIAATSLLVGELLCEAVDLRSGSAVLDVACGTGNAALAAARRFCSVTGVDFVPALLERGRARAAFEGLDVEFVEGDAEALPFPDASFDVVLSTFGVMFAPDQATAAAELLRVCRPGGRIGLACWTPEGFWGEMSRVIAHHVSPPSGLLPPTRWGTDDGIRELIGHGVHSLAAERRQLVHRFPSTAMWLEFRRTNYGPTMRAYATLDPAGQDALSAGLIEVADRFNRADDGTMVIPNEYLEMVAQRA